jgi:hypothetical protein
MNITHVLPDLTFNNRILPTSVLQTVKRCDRDERRGLACWRLGMWTLKGCKEEVRKWGAGSCKSNFGRMQQHYELEDKSEV